jgi:hypothetical protein
MTNGWPTPASRELGANWVEVTVWERMKCNSTKDRNDLKTWPATARRFHSAADDEQTTVSRVGVAFPDFGRSSRGRPAIRLIKNWNTEDTEKN